MQPRLLMQFHITGRCNLRCKHCYREEGDTEPLTTEDVISVIDQYAELLMEYNSIWDLRRKGHINITGGEPFIRKDIREILEYLGEHKKRFSYGILSNGSFIDGEMIRVLKETEVSFVQLSIDGDRRTHDDLRAKGDYDRVFRCAEYLEHHGIRTYISFTANKDNHRYLPKVAAKCRRLGITKLWSDRLVPIGSGSDLSDLAITADGFHSYMRSMNRAKGSRFTRLIFPKTAVTSNRALQFLETDGAMYSCSAGDSLITVDEFGRVMPCRRMPIICGNIRESTLRDIYAKSEVFRELRMKAFPQECGSCDYRYHCRGGAKCQSYAVYGSFDRKDPGCPLKF